MTIQIAGTTVIDNSGNAINLRNRIGGNLQTYYTSIDTTYSPIALSGTSAAYQVFYGIASNGVGASSGFVGWRVVLDSVTLSATGNYINVYFLNGASSPTTGAYYVHTGGEEVPSSMLQLRFSSYTKHTYELFIGIVGTDNSLSSSIMSPSMMIEDYNNQGYTPGAGSPNSVPKIVTLLSSTAATGGIYIAPSAGTFTGGTLQVYGVAI